MWLNTRNQQLERDFVLNVVTLPCFLLFLLTSLVFVLRTYGLNFTPHTSLFSLLLSGHLDSSSDDRSSHGVVSMFYCVGMFSCIPTHVSISATSFTSSSFYSWESVGSKRKHLVQKLSLIFFFLHLCGSVIRQRQNHTVGIVPGFDPSALWLCVLYNHSNQCWKEGNFQKVLSSPAFWYRRNEMEKKKVHNEPSR